MKLSEYLSINFKIIKREIPSSILLVFILALVLVINVLLILLPNNLTQVSKALSENLFKENVLVLRKEDKEDAISKIANQFYVEANNQFFERPIEQVLSENKNSGLKQYRQFKSFYYPTNTASTDNQYKIELAYTLVPQEILKDTVISQLSPDHDTLNVFASGLNNQNVKNLSEVKKELTKLVGYEQTLEYRVNKPFEFNETLKYPAKIKVRIVGVGSFGSLGGIAVETPDIVNIIRQKLPKTELEIEFPQLSSTPLFLEFDTKENKNKFQQKYKLVDYIEQRSQVYENFSSLDSLILIAASQSGLDYDQILQIMNDERTGIALSLFYLFAPVLAIILLFTLDFSNKRKVYARFLILNFKKTQVLQLIILRYISIILPAILLSTVISIAFLFFFEWRFNLYFNAFRSVVPSLSQLNQIHPLNLDYWWLVRDLSLQFIIVLSLATISTLALLIINKKKHLN